MKKNLPLKLLNFLLLIASVFVMIWPAIYNGYPLLYFDSASYIVSGHLCKVPIDRPLAYGLLVKHISMSFSLWFVVVFQASLFVLLTWLSFRMAIKKDNTSIFTFITCILVGFFSGASNYASQIMPDIFSGFMIWAIALLWFAERAIFRWILLGIAVFSALVHFSNMLTITVLSLTAIVALVLFRKKIKQFKSLVFQFVILLMAPWILMLSLNFVVEKEWFVNKSSSVFFTGRLIETGILKKYFYDYPESSKYSLYQRRDSLPEKCWQFVWNADSPLFDPECLKTGWENCWLSKTGEYQQMIRGALSKPPLLRDFIFICAKDWKSQLLDFEIGPLTVFDAKSSMNGIIFQYFDDAYMTKNSNQFSNNLPFTAESNIQKKFVALAFILLTFVLVVSVIKKTRKSLLFSFLVVAAGILINALICSAFSNVLNRYQARVIWLVGVFAIFFAILVFYEFLKSGKRST